MTWEIAVALTAIIGVPLAILSIALVVKQQAREQAKARSEERQRVYNEGFQDGLNHLQPTVDLRTSERDDARRERDEYRADLRNRKDN